MAPKRLTDLRPSLPQPVRGLGRNLLASAFALATIAHAGPAASAAALPPGAMPCTTSGSPAGYGSFLLLKHTDFTQSSAAAPTAAGALASIELAPPSLYSISNAIVSGPGSFKAALTRQANGSSTWSDTGTEAALNTALPAGVGSVSFQLGFTNGDSFIGFFPFTLAATTPPAPQVANFDAAQSVNPQTAFALSWNTWVGATTNDRVNLTLTDATGNVVFSAATDCTGQNTLAATDSSLTVPAGRLTANTTYSGYLTFGAWLGGGSDDSTQIHQRTFASRTTRFSLKTGTGGSSGGSPGTFEGPTISGTNLVFTLKGSPGEVHRIESTTDFATWTPESTVTLPTSGSIEVKLALATSGAPKFYRAVAVGGSTPTVGPAQLSLTLAGPRDLDIAVTGTVGATYNVELTFDGTAWTRIATATITAANTPAIIRVNVPEGQNFALVRAVSQPGPPPPVELKAPTLAASITNLNNGAFQGFRIALSGGTPRRSYTIEQRSTAAGGTWVSTTQSTLATDASGNGTMVIFLNRGFPGAPVPTQPSGFLFRASIR